jgi:hypothetical protein
MKRFQRKNGFSKPPGAWQIVAGLLFLLEVASVSVLVVPFLSTAFQVTCI